MKVIFAYCNEMVFNKRGLLTCNTPAFPKEHTALPKKHRDDVAGGARERSAAQVWLGKNDIKPKLKKLNVGIF